MRVHKGDHPRFGATDVCPLVPVSNITMEETVVYARKLSERVGKELNIPVYCYEQAAYKEEYRSLANCRKGEYEELKDRLSNKESQPNFGLQCLTKALQNQELQPLEQETFSGSQL